MKAKITVILLMLCTYCIKAYSQLTIDSIVIVNSSSGCTCTGRATAYVSKGYPPYTYSWTNGEMGRRDTDLCPRNYGLFVYDSHGDSAGRFFAIGPAAMTTTVRSTGAGCADTAGSATALTRGGTLPYTYSWAPGGGTTVTISHLSAGTYTVTVKDAGGCTVTASTTISSSLLFGARSVNVTCNGGTNGLAFVTNINGGKSPYTYSWAPSGGSLDTAKGLSSGIYTVTVKDSAGCTGTTTVLVNQPPAMVDSVTYTGAPCGINYGTATAIVGGGTRPYTYSWSSGATTANASNLSAGIYSVTITDRNGCTSSTSVTVGISGPIPAIAVVNDSCYGENKGSATVTNITGGVSPYTYSWAPSGGTGNSATGLSAGTYTLTIKDAGGCSGTTLVTLRQPPAMTLTVDTMGATNGCNGTANITVAGANGPLVFTWSVPHNTTITSRTTATTDSLCAGRYLLCVTNRAGCTVCDSVIISGKVVAGISQLANTTVAINLYPDPVHSELTVQINGINAQTCQLEVYDMLGREVMQQNNIAIESGKSIYLNVSALPQGEYMLRISNSSLNEYQPFIIAH